MKLSQVAENIRDSRLLRDVEFETVSTDTRSLQPGDLFVALRGEHHDGHRFLSSARERGACGAVVEVPMDVDWPQLVVSDTVRALGVLASLKRKAFAGKIAAITGSCGKTTVKTLLRDICQQVGKILATQGNFNNHIGVPMTLLRLQGDEDFAVVEAGTSGRGEIAYLGGLIRPDVALVNNIMPAHLQGLGSRRGVAEEKADLYAALDAGGCAVINLDDEFADYFLASCAHLRCIGFGMNPVQPAVLAQLALVVSGENPQALGEGETGFDIVAGEERISVRLNPGNRASLCNALAASACALALGLNLSQIQQGLANCTGVAGRMQRVASDRARLLIDDSYNANPGSVAAAIDYLSSFDHSLLILGDMAELGADTEIEHRRVGALARERGIERLLATGEFSRYTVDAFGHAGCWYATRDALVDAMDEMDLRDWNLLVKGSRSAGMEQVVNALAAGGEK